MSTRPFEPLCDSRGRFGRVAAILASSMRRMSGANFGSAGATTPRSSSSTTPACSAPAPTNKPDLNPTKVNVISARTAASCTAPLSAFTPEGMSSASTGRFAALMARITANALRPRRPGEPDA
jgi:hypothetical protein